MAKKTKEEILKETIKRSLIAGKVYRTCMYDLAQSETLKLYAANAKKEKNSKFVDLRPKATEAVRIVDANVLTLKKTISADAFRDINTILQDDSLHEILTLLELVADAKACTIADINTIVREAMEKEKQQHQNQS